MLRFSDQKKVAVSLPHVHASRRRPRTAFLGRCRNRRRKDHGDVGKDFVPARSNTLTNIWFSLAPDGKSFVYGVVKSKSNLWLLQGFEPKTDLLSRLGLH
jgi:hypothetical protein